MNLSRNDPLIDCMTGLPIFPQFQHAAKYLFFLCDNRGYYPPWRAGGLKAAPTEPAELVYWVNRMCEEHNYHHNALDQRDHALIAYAAMLSGKESA